LVLAPRAGRAGPGVDDGVYLNSEYRRFLPILRKTASSPPLTRETLAAVRSPAVAPPLPQPAVSERVIPGPRGAPDVKLYIINPGAPGTARPAILHLHGGGFVGQSARGAVRELQRQAEALDCVIVTVEYRLAPETPFPGSLEDNYAALKWLYANAASVGVDRTRLAVAGESAGGGHAAMLAIAARDRGGPPVIFQALTYPMLDDRTGSTRQPPPHIGQFLWRREDNRFGWTSLLGAPAGSNHPPYGSVPARVEDLRGLPPAFIAVGSIDLFVDEDIAYARRLVNAGVPTELHVYPGAFHGFDLFPTKLTERFRAARLEALKAALYPS